ncbi:hypothetical protein Hanom_Chr09g00783531 [Helianthus anomalus]
MIEMLREGSPYCIVRTKPSMEHLNENFFYVKKYLVPFEIPHQDPAGPLDLPILRGPLFDFPK